MEQNNLDGQYPIIQDESTSQFDRKKNLLNVLNLFTCSFIAILLASYILAVKQSHQSLCALVIIQAIFFFFFEACQIKHQERKIKSETVKKSHLRNDFFSKFISINEQYQEILQVVLRTSLYVGLFELLLVMLDYQEIVITISYFLSIFSKMILKNMKFIQIAYIFLVGQQIYSIIRIFIVVKLSIFFIILNISYFIFVISFIDNQHTTSKAQKIIQLNEKNKTENIMKLYKSILSIIPEGIAVINSEKKLLYANSTLKKILQSNNKQDIIQILLNLGNNSSVPKKDESVKQTTDNNSEKKHNSQFIFKSKKRIHQRNTYNEISQFNPNSKIDQKTSEFQNKQSISQQKAFSSKQINEQSIVEIKQDDKHDQNQQQSIQINSQNQIQEENQESSEYNSQISIEQRDKQDFHQNVKEENKNQDLRTSIKVEKTSNSNNEYQKNIINELPKQFILFPSKKIGGIKIDSKHQTKRKSIFTRNNTNQSSLGNCNSDQSEILSYQGFGFNQDEDNEPQKKNQGLERQSNHRTSGSISNKANIADSSIERSKSIALQSKSWKIAESSKSAISEIGNKKNKSISQLSQYNISNNGNDENSKQNEKDEIEINNSKIGKKESCQEQVQMKQDNQLTYKFVMQKQESGNNQKKDSQLIDTELNQNQLENQAQKDRNTNNQNNNIQKKNQAKSYSISIEQIPLNSQKKDSLSVYTNKGRMSQQTTSPFIMKVKSRKSQQPSQLNNQIALAQTNVQSIVDWMLYSGKEQFIQLQNPQSSNNDTNKSISTPQNKQSKKPFLQHFQQQSQANLSYIQQTDTQTKIQVKHNDKDIILNFLRVDLISENMKNDSLVLVMVQDLWQDLYKKKVQDLQKDKMKLFASLSHELRTPLNCSISMLEVLKDEMQQNNQKYIDEYINPALFSSKLLLNQINDILDFVQIDSGKFKYSFVDFSILGLLKDCQKLISMQASMKKIQIKIVIQKGVPEMICSDPNRIRQILLNFLSNALKFTLKGYIEIGIAPFQQNLYEIYVKDTGIGIMQENIDKIFQFCNKISYNKKDENLNSQGCGLGLTISNQIANGLVQNKGCESFIKVQSEYGQGSRFSILVQDMDFQVHSKHFLKDQIQISLNDLKGERGSEYSNQDQLSPLKNNYKKKNSQFDKAALKNINEIQQEINMPQIQVEQSYADLNNQSIDCLKSFNYQTNMTEEKNQFFGNEKNNLKPKFQKASNNQIDSALIIEFEEDKQQNLQIHSHISIKNNLDQYQEPELNSLEKIQSSNSNYQSLSKSQNKQLKISLTKSPIQQKQNSNDLSFLEEHKKQSSLNTESIQSQKTSENEKGNKKQETENIYENNKKAVIQSFITKNYKTQETLPQIDRQISIVDQEGFTSYVGFTKYYEKQQSSSRNMNTSTLQIDKNSQLQKFDTQNKCIDNEKFEVIKQKSMDQQEAKICQSDIIQLIIEKNKQKKKICQCPQIVIVDDNQFNLYALGKIIEQYHFSYATASAGDLAIQEIKNIHKSNCCQAPKIIFLDIEMPIKNGYETAIEIIQFYKSVNINQFPTLIACTAYIGQEDQQKIFNVGMGDFINKPILKNAFQQLILNWSHMLI